MPSRPDVRAFAARGGATVWGWLGRNAYLVVAAAALLVVGNAVEFEPPAQVRIDSGHVAAMVGDAPSQEFSDELGNPQAVQVRATLRMFPMTDADVSTPDPEIDDRARVLSQPVVTTILGLNANIQQTVRLDGDLEVDLTVDAAPRLVGRARKGRPPRLTLEHTIAVVSRTPKTWRKDPTRRTHVQTRGVLAEVEDSPYRLVFTIEERLFALDLEVHRPGI